jgi:hypothetical protein
MNSKLYIKDKLRNLVEKFPQMTFLYQFDEIDQTHIVEVLPFTKYEEDNDYKNDEGDLTFEFDRMFFPETIMFVSENSLTRVNELEEVFKRESFLAFDNIEVTVSDDFGNTEFNFFTDKNFIDFKADLQIFDKFILSSGPHELEVIKEAFFPESKYNYALAA